MRTVLHVAEKNDAAKTIASILSAGSSTRREGKSKYNKLYTFNFNNSLNVMTSVSGHMMNYEFVGEYRKWQSCDPVSLFTCPIEKIVPENMLNIKLTLEQQSKKAHKLVIWTDCDREGENIGQEIVDVCIRSHSNLDVYRARFSEMTQRSIFHAVSNLVRLDTALSEAVEARQELDFRIGCAFTRFQTLHLRKRFASHINAVVSYGACQFPTLGFVVERYKEAQAFVPEEFHKIKVTVEVENGDTEFQWTRGRLFNHHACLVLYHICLENPTATVTHVTSRPKSKWRPVALETVQFEKIASRKLGMNAQQAMKVAESLYSKGLISYPRTETNKFPKSMVLSELVSKHTSHGEWGEFAARVLENGPNPRQGNKSDEAHPPIHPTKCVTNLSGPDKKVYDYVTRHFLACVSKDATGTETTAKIDIAGETFTAKGLVILEKNYLLVYVYESWNAKLLPHMEVGQQFQPKSIEMVEGHTTAPPLLTEADLIGLMETHGIGTDATHAEHIETIKNRSYVGLTPDLRFIPGQLGMGLVDGYDSMSFNIGLSKPDMRAATENELRLIAMGQKNRAQVVQEMLAVYKEVFERAVVEVRQLDTKLSECFGIQPPGGGGGGGGGGDGSGGGGGGGYGGGGGNHGGGNNDDDDHQGPSTYMKCRSCGVAEVVLKTTRNGSRVAGCLGYPRCTASLFFPPSVLKVAVTSGKCSRCVPDPPFLLAFKFKPGSVPPTIPTEYTACLLCDSELNELLEVRRKLLRPPTSAPSTNKPTPTSTRSTTSVFRPPPNSQNFSRVESEDNDVFMTRSLAGAVSSHGLPSNSSGVGDGQPPPNCVCERPAKLLTVNKDSENKGKKFYGCDGRVCDYFCWEDKVGAPSGSATTRGAPASNGGSTAYNGGSTTFNGGSTTSTGLNYRPTTQGQDGGGYGANLETSDTNIVCNCGTSAKKLTVRKQNENFGKEFFGCSTRTCQFFMWADADNQNGGSSGNSGGTQSNNSWDSQSGGTGWGPQGGNSFSTQNKTSWSNSNNTFSSQRKTQNTFKAPTNSGDQSGEKSCECGNPAVTRTVKKEGDNKGRVFWTCSKPFDEKCNMFEWADDVAATGGSSTQTSRKRPPPGGGGGTGKQRCCSVCRQPGHTKKNCPQNDDF